MSEVEPLLPKANPNTPYRIILVIFVIMFGAFLADAPLLRIYEDIICHHYIPLTGKIDEGLCKGDEVQEELATVVGGMEIAASLPGNIAYPEIGCLS